MKIRLSTDQLSDSDASVNMVAQVVQFRDQLGSLSQHHTELRDGWISVLREWYLDRVFTDLPRDDIERHLDTWTGTDGNGLLEKFYRRSLGLLLSDGDMNAHRDHESSNSGEQQEQKDSSNEESPLDQLKSIGTLSRRVGMQERIKHTKPIVARVQLSVLDELLGETQSPQDTDTRWIALRIMLDEWLHRVANHDLELKQLTEASNRKVFEVVSGNLQAEERMDQQTINQRQTAKKVLTASAILSVVVLLGMIVYLGYESDKLHEQEKKEHDVLSGKQAALRLSEE